MSSMKVSDSHSHSKGATEGNTETPPFVTKRRNKATGQEPPKPPILSTVTTRQQKGPASSNETKSETVSGRSTRSQYVDADKRKCEMEANSKKNEISGLATPGKKKKVDKNETPMDVQPTKSQKIPHPNVTIRKRGMAKNSSDLSVPENVTSKSLTPNAVGSGLKSEEVVESGHVYQVSSNFPKATCIHLVDDEGFNIPSTSKTKIPSTSKDMNGTKKRETEAIPTNTNMPGSSTTSTTSTEPLTKQLPQQNREATPEAIEVDDAPNDNYFDETVYETMETINETIQPNKPSIHTHPGGLSKIANVNVPKQTPPRMYHNPLKKIYPVYQSTPVRDMANVDASTWRVNPMSKGTNYSNDVFSRYSELEKSPIKKTVDSSRIENRGGVKPKKGNQRPVLVSKQNLVNVDKLVLRDTKMRKQTMPSMQQISTPCKKFKIAYEFLSKHGWPEKLGNKLFDRCYCRSCYAKDLEGTCVIGGKTYVCPRGYTRIGVHIDEHFADHNNIWECWHNVYHGTTIEKAMSIVEHRGLLVPGDEAFNGNKIKINPGHFPERNEYFTTPSISYAALPVYASSYNFKSTSEEATYSITVVVQLKQRPDSFVVQKETVGAGNKRLCPYIKNEELEWRSKKRASIVPYGVLLLIQKFTSDTYDEFIGRKHLKDSSNLFRFRKCPHCSVGCNVCKEPLDNQIVSVKCVMRKCQKEYLVFMCPYCKTLKNDVGKKGMVFCVCDDIKCLKEFLLTKCPKCLKVNVCKEVSLDDNVKCAYEGCNAEWK